MGGCSWLVVVVNCDNDQFVMVFFSGMYYFIVLNILFYYDIYIILLC